jgi:hypothetical protein
MPEFSNFCHLSQGVDIRLTTTAHARYGGPPAPTFLYELSSHSV